MPLVRFVPFNAAGAFGTDDRPANPPGRNDMRTRTMVGFVVVLASASLAAQSTPPTQIPNVIEGRVAKLYRGVNTLVVTTVDGVQHIYRFAKGLVVHGGSGSGDRLDTLQEGTTVVVHYRIEGAEQMVEEIDRVADEGLKVSEAVVLRLNRPRREITLKFANGTTETLRLTDRAASEAAEDIGPAGSTRVTVYYSDESGQKVAHYFRKTS
jgi:hypothetical protein